MSNRPSNRRNNSQRRVDGRRESSAEGSTGVTGGRRQSSIPFVADSYRNMMVDADAGGDVDGRSNISEAEEVAVGDLESEENRSGFGSSSSEDDDEGEDLFNNSQLMKDYEDRPELDRYDPALIDDAPVRKAASLSVSQRRRVERLLDARDKRLLAETQQEADGVISSSSRYGRQQQQRGFRGFERMSGLLGDGDEEDEDDEVFKLLRERRNRMREAAESTMGRFAVREAEQAKDELPFCSGKHGLSERINEILYVLFSGFLYLYVRPRIHQAGFNLSSRDATTDGDAGAAEGEADEGNSRNAASSASSQSQQTNNNQTYQQTQSDSQPDSQPSAAGAGAGAEGSYIQQIDEMAHRDATSIAVWWADLRNYCPKLLEWFYQLPHAVLSVLSRVVTDVTRERFPRLYQNRNIVGRLTGYDSVESLKLLNTDLLNTLVCVRGVVLRRTVVQPRVFELWLECVRCNCDTNGPFARKDGEDFNIRKLNLVCEDCQSRGPFIECRQKLVYQNYQRLSIQEPPQEVTPGHVPKHKNVVIFADLVDSVKPGDEVVITGVYETNKDARLNVQSGFAVFGTQIVANNIEKQKEILIAALTDSDLEIIHKLARNKDIREKIISSIAPSIWGYHHVKTGLAYVMLGSFPKHLEGGHTIRGDLNFLLLGDPGVGKSQFLKYVEKTANRCIMTTGKGSTAVGLTAAIRRDEINGEWYLEGGALVLADQGICLIDEFDKMADQDRVSIHEAMEQQSISISKAGIVTTLKARCSVIAAANPVLGRYDNSLTFSQNVDLSDAILSRFDILAVVRDKIHPVSDEQLARHVVSTHSNNRSSSSGAAASVDPEDNEELIDVNAKWVTGKGRIPQSFLRKYIMYAKNHCFPIMRKRDVDLLVKFYTELRQASNLGGLAITTRHLESILRMSCANARMRLSPYVDQRDVRFAISTMLESFIQSQKYAVAVHLGKRFGKYRALASSPEEFIESVLMELMDRSTRKILDKHEREAQRPSELHSRISRATVCYDHLVTMARSQYQIPEAAVVKYMESKKFKSQFGIQTTLDERNEKKVSIVSKSAAAPGTAAPGTAAPGTAAPGAASSAPNNRRPSA